MLEQFLNVPTNKARQINEITLKHSYKFCMNHFWQMKVAEMPIRCKSLGCADLSFLKFDLVGLF